MSGSDAPWDRPGKNGPRALPKNQFGRWRGCWACAEGEHEGEGVGKLFDSVRYLVPNVRSSSSRRVQIVSPMSKKKLVLQNNAAISSEKEDLLGIQDLAKHIAHIANPSEDSDPLIIGIEAEWGAGKSSLIELTKAEITRNFADTYIVVEFAPWMIGSRDELLRQFFDTVIEAIAHASLAEGKPGEAARGAASEAVDGLKKLAKRIGPLSKLARVVGDAGVPFVGFAAPIFEAVGAIGDAETPETSLSELKARIQKSIGKIDRRILIIVDDLDRLEPTEIVEIFRLIRAVLDIDSFTYLLCYDKQIMWNALEKSFGEREARLYLEKIIRLEVKVPNPEHGSLMDIFKDGLEKIVPELTADDRDSIYFIFQNWGRRYLKTPRSINRVCDNISFVLSGSKIELNISDLVWISILKIGSPNYYRFVEDYLNIWAYRILDRGNLAKGEAEGFESRFSSLAEQDGFDETMELIMLDSILPGIKKYTAGGETQKFLGGRNEDPADVAKRRIGTADYGRAYFALGPASVTPSEEEIQHLQQLLLESDSTKLIEGLSIEISKGESEKFLQILERVSVRLQNESGNEFFPLLEALCSIGHHLLTFAPKETWHRPIVWEKIEEILCSGSALDDLARIKRAIRSAPDLCWVSDLLASEQRRVNKGYPDERVFSDEIRADLWNYLASQYSNLTIEEIVGSVRPESIWFPWLHHDKKSFAEFLVKRTRKNVDLLAFLGSFWTRSSGGRDYIVKEDLEPLLDPTVVEQRVLRLLKRGGEIGQEAKIVANRLMGWDQDTFGVEP